MFVHAPPEPAHSLNNFGMQILALPGDIPFKCTPLKIRHQDQALYPPLVKPAQLPVAQLREPIIFQPPGGSIHQKVVRAIEFQHNFALRRDIEQHIHPEAPP